MAETYMSPRSAVYSGGVALGTEPVNVPSSRPGGFLAGLERFAGTVAPFVEAAAAFKRGYDTGLPLPGRYGGSRMAGQEFIFQVLEDMRAKNEIASERAREERETARQQDLKTQVLLKAYENKEISLQDLMKGIESGDLPDLDSAEPLPSQQASSAAKPQP